MWTRIRTFWPSAPTWRRLGLAGGAAGLLVLAFCCGRSCVTHVAMAAPPGGIGPLPGIPASYAGSDSYRRPVAYIHNSIPITREELGEYLIARFGEERIEFLVNRRIIEHACQAKGITVSDAEVNAQLVEDLRQMNVGLKDFVNNVLRRFNKTLFEYKEDVIRPKLALIKFCKDLINPTPEDLQKAFEAHYGEKVECRMIILAKELPAARRSEVWTECSKSEKLFDKNATDPKVQFIKDLAEKGGRVPPIHKHFGDDRIEKRAFNLERGQVSELFEMSDGTTVILRCENHLPPVTDRSFDAERMTLYKEVSDLKLSQEIPRVFQVLKKNANPEIFLKKDLAQEDLEQRRTSELLTQANGQQPGPGQQPGTPPAGGVRPQQQGSGLQQTGGTVPHQPQGPGLQQTGGTVPQQQPPARPVSPGEPEMLPPLGR